MDMSPSGSSLILNEKRSLPVHLSVATIKKKALIETSKPLVRRVGGKNKIGARFVTGFRRNVSDALLTTTVHYSAANCFDLHAPIRQKSLFRYDALRTFHDKLNITAVWNNLACEQVKINRLGRVMELIVLVYFQHIHTLQLPHFNYNRIVRVWMEPFSFWSQHRIISTTI